VSILKGVVLKRRGANVPEGWHALVSMCASSPLLFCALFLFLLVLAVPFKIFSPRTRIFR